MKLEHEQTKVDVDGQEWLNGIISSAPTITRPAVRPPAAMKATDRPTVVVVEV